MPLDILPGHLLDEASLYQVRFTLTKRYFYYATGDILHCLGEFIYTTGKFFYYKVNTH